MQLLVTSWLSFLTEIAIEFPFWWLNDECIFLILWYTDKPFSFRFSSTYTALAFPCGFRQRQEKKFFLYNIFRPIGKWVPSFFTNLKLQPSGKKKINLVKWLWMIVGPNSTENIFKQKYPVHEKSILMSILVESSKVHEPF